MRLVTWNCYRGECLRRSSQLDPLDADVIVLQECRKPNDEANGKAIWFGDRVTQGVGAVARGEWSVQRGVVDERVIDSVYPIQVAGPIAFNLLEIWAQPRPTYVRAVLEGLKHYRTFIRSAPTVIAGDFNSHPVWDRKARVNHTALVEYLRDEFGLVSAYHVAASTSGATSEEATCYWQWKESQPFHLDYCFIPTDWVHRLKRVEVGGYAAWADKSDHRPLLVEITDCRSFGRNVNAVNY
jgi:exonuclease III